MGHQVEGLLDRILYTAGVAAGFGVRRDSQKPVDSGRGPLGGLADRLQIGLEVVVATLVDLLPGQLGIPADDKERVVQFMRDPAQKGAQRGELLHLLEVLLDPLALGPIVDDSDVMGHPPLRDPQRRDRQVDRKSTRLNSSHSQISYAVFCLKKKKLS